MTFTKATALTIIAAVITVSFPLLADARAHRDHVRSAMPRQSAPINTDAARAAFGAGSPTYGFGTNSPAANGGGSFGYNEKLRIY
jgi:hypothetical protein